MESLPLQQLADETLQALVKANASKNYQKVFKTVSRNFIVYAQEHDIDSFSIDHGLQFLEDHYSMSQKMSEKKWNGVMEQIVHTKMLHDFDSGVMFDEPFLRVDLNGQRFHNEDINMDVSNNDMRYYPLHSAGKYAQIFDDNYVDQARRYHGSYRYSYL